MYTCVYNRRRFEYHHLGVHICISATKLFGNAMRNGICQSVLQYKYMCFSRKSDPAVEVKKFTFSQYSLWVNALWKSVCLSVQLVSILSHWQWWIITREKNEKIQKKHYIPTLSKHTFTVLQHSHGAIMHGTRFVFSPCSWMQAVYRYIPIRADILIT